MQQTSCFGDTHRIHRKEWNPAAFPPSNGGRPKSEVGRSGSEAGAGTVVSHAMASGIRKVIRAILAVGERNRPRPVEPCAPLDGGGSCDPSTT